eukprot:6291743-Amphidinium_carterae.1
MTRDFSPNFRTNAGAVAQNWVPIEAQHIKQVIQEMTIPKLSKNISMSINTDSSASKAVANRLWVEQEDKACTVEVSLHAGHCTE